jgi:LacI family transcriptional regulator
MTVSRALSGKRQVSERTRQKVADAVASLHYAPSQEARGLAGYKPIRVGFLHSNPSAAYLSEFLLGLAEQAGLNNVQLFVEKCTSGAHVEAQVRRLASTGLQGVILPPPLCDDQAVIAQIKSYDIPVVAVACGRPDPALDAVTIDDQRAAYEMTRHLVSLGHRRIGFVSGHPDQTASARRLAGYQAAVADLGVEASPELMARGLFTYRSGLDAAEQLLDLAERPTAIFASNDDMAAAVVAVAQRIGLDVPGDLTVAGFDDVALATTIWPELTTVRQPIADMARKAMEIIVRRVRLQDAGDHLGPEQVQMKWELIRRQSDAAPRHRPPAWLSAVHPPQMRNPKTD